MKILLFAAVLLSLASATTRAQEAVKTDSALSIAPADSSFFLTSLRNKEQVDIFYKSNAYKTLRSLPLVKEAYEKIKKEMSAENGAISKYQEFVKDKDNKELVDLLLELGVDEFFIQGGSGFKEILNLASKINNAQSFGPLQALLSRADPEKGQSRAIFLALQKNLDLITIPELVLGFRVKDRTKADNQLKRLEKILGGLSEVVAQLKNRVETKKVGESNFVTVTLDGSMIPWEDANLAQFEEEKGEFQELIKKVKGLKLTISMGVKDGYLMLGLTPSAATMEKFGSADKSLATLAEMKPLAKHADKPLTSITYISKDLFKAASGQGDLPAMMANLKGMLEKVEAISPDRRKAIAKDLDELVDEAKKSTSTFGAQLGFNFMTPTGYEGYSHQYGEFKSLAGVDCKLQQNLGGNPILAAAFGCDVSGDNYRSLVKLLKKVHGHAEAIGLEKIPADAKEQYQTMFKAVLPVLKKLDDITSSTMIPSIKQSGLGLVLDAKWKSKQWVGQLPAMENAMPMLELGLLVGLDDAKGFEKAMTGYRETLSELYAKIREASPSKEQMPEFAIPAPETEAVSSGKLFFYSLPDFGQDKQIQPVFGIGKTSSVLALSKAHAERLMAGKSLEAKFAPLSRTGNKLGVAVLDWVALVDAFSPWTEFAIKSNPNIDDGSRPEILKQAKTALEVLRCLKGGATASFIEDGNIVSHNEVKIKDLEKAPE